MVEQYARGNLQSLLRPGNDHDLLLIAMHGTRGSEVRAYSFAKLYETKRTTVV
jgi:hypothetical protein